MSLTERFAAARAARSGSSASSLPSSVLVVGDAPQHGRTVTREVVGNVVVARVVRSPFTRAALEGRLPTHKEAPLD